MFSVQPLCGPAIAYTPADMKLAAQTFVHTASLLFYAILEMLVVVLIAFMLQIA